MKKLVTTKDLQEILQVSRQAIYKWRLEGLPYKSIGTSIRFDPDEVIEWIEKQNKNRQKED